MDIKHIVTIIKTWATIQLIIIILLIVIFILTHLILQYKGIMRNKHINKINQLLNVIAKDPAALTESVISFFNQYILEFVFCFEKADEQNQKNTYWNVTKVIISNHVLKAQIGLLASSRHWFNRYLSARCYSVGININDEELLLKLLKDKVLIISINAALLIINEPSSRSINAIIDTYSKERHTLRLMLINILMNHPIKNGYFILDIIMKRLYVEKDIYAKILCYEIATLLKSSGKIDPIVKNDLLIDNVDLKIAILRYISHVDVVMSKSILLNYLNDAHDEVRAVSARLLGNASDKSIIPYLKHAMNDRSWWVRINSANSLANLGPDGVAALESFSPHDDKFAYETAEAFLKIQKEYGKKLI